MTAEPSWLTFYGMTLSVVLALVTASSARLWADDSQILINAAPSPSDIPETDSTAVAAIKLIEAMADALNLLTYEGEFVHAQGTSLTSMQIMHSPGTERLRALDGEARIVFRDDTLVTCIWPDTQSVVVSKSRPRELLPQVDRSLADNDNYVFSLGTLDRVAGRQTKIVEVRPRDQFRYGYRFWVDSGTSMLLRSMLLDNAGRPVEQIIFTEISFPEHLDSTLLDIPDSKANASWLLPKKASATALLDEQNPLGADRVQFGELPRGYREVAETYSLKAISDEPVSHVMLSDGMSSVSVYVEYSLAGEKVTVQGHSQMGAINAYSLSTPSALITAVGEVPAATVKALAEAVVLVE
ncbi:MAG: MucB/RseB C-terminal domain-containing protein [Granulosicoccus sp.]